MATGFNCGDGWEPIIRRLSARLEAMIAAMPENDRSRFRASDVKQKLGELRFYVEDHTLEIDEAIREAEREASCTCEECGRPGTRGKSGGYVAVWCTACREVAAERIAGGAPDP